MAAKNSVKDFVPNSYYHLYNRGVEKRDIFMDEQDRVVCLSYLKTYLLQKDKDGLRAVLVNPESSPKQKDQALKLLRLNNFADSLKLLSFCLMPNHFHFLVWQKEAETIDRFMNSFGVRYSMYFNRKYRRVGPLFQGLYKAVRVTSGEQLLHLSRYIHRNPLKLASQDTLLQNFSYSSYPQYLGVNNASWLHPEEILSYFSKSQIQGYREFVEGPIDESITALVAEIAHDEE